QQYAGVERLALETLNERLPLFRPRPLQNHIADVVRARRPELCTLRESQMKGDLREPVAACPAHDARRRVNASARAQLPDPRIGLIVQLECLFSDAFEADEIFITRPHEQPRV